MSGRLIRHWRALIGLTLACLVGAFLAPHVARPPELQEKRALAEFPRWPEGPGDLARFRHGVDDYVADNFPARPFLIGGLNILRLPLMTTGSERVIYGRQGWLFYDDGTHLGAVRNDPPMTNRQAQTWLEHLAGRTEALKARGARYLIVVPPQKETIYPGMGPPWYRGPDPQRPAVRLSRAAGESGVGEVLYLHDALATPARWGLKTFDRLDTHWTGLGAYEAYVAIMARLQALGVGEAPRPLSSFHEIPPAATDPRDLALMLGVASFLKPDHPRFDDPQANATLRVTYLSANHAWTGPRVIDTGQLGKPVALITVDSFSNALLPFLYGHFSRLILAHNQDGTWREDLIGRFKPNVVMLEVVESGLPVSLEPAPQTSSFARARIAAALARSSAIPALASATAAATEGPDRFQGGPEADVFDGRDGDDVIRGGRGDDRIRGGRGNDWLSGDRGDDALWGGLGADTFHSFGAAGDDQVMDFSAAEGDRVELEAHSLYTVRQVGPDTVIRIVGGARLILAGVRADDLGPAAIFVAR